MKTKYCISLGLLLCLPLTVFAQSRDNCDGAKFEFGNSSPYAITNVKAENSGDFDNLFSDVGLGQVKSASMNPDNGQGNDLAGDVNFDFVDENGTTVAKGTVSYKYIWSVTTCHTYSDDPGYGVPAPTFTPVNNSGAQLAGNATSSNGSGSSAYTYYSFSLTTN